MRINKHQDLWQRIKDFEIDDPQAAYRFSHKLASQNNWIPAYTQRVIEEYKRFIFLCCISPHGASPSEDVDEAWHLHLTYTDNYWNKFCRETLQKDIHHHPSKGGFNEKHRHEHWYEETLAFYEEVFGEKAPPDIWPVQVQTRSQSTIIPLEYSWKPPYKLIILLLLAPFLVPFTYGEITPYTLDGPDFLVFYFLLALASLITWIVFYFHNRKIVLNVWQNHYKKDANAYQLSRFIFGRNRSVQAAIVDLVQQGVLTAGNGSLYFRPGNYIQQANEVNPLIENLLKRYNEDHVLSYEEVESCYDDNKTWHQDLSDIFKAVSVGQIKAWLIPLFVVIVGVVRVFQGINNDKPVEYLLVMMGVLVLLHILFYQFIRYTDILRTVVNSGYRNWTLGNAYTISTPVNQYVFMGLAGLGAYYSIDNLETIFKRKYETDGSSSSSGCGSSCGGSGCGGGGGGCGGCGGGD
jgi:hypothetical protein